MQRQIQLNEDIAVQYSRALDEIPGFRERNVSSPIKAMVWTIGGALLVGWAIYFLRRSPRDAVFSRTQKPTAA